MRSEGGASPHGHDGLKSRLVTARGIGPGETGVRADPGSTGRNRGWAWGRGACPFPGQVVSGRRVHGVVAARHRLDRCATRVHYVVQGTRTFVLNASDDSQPPRRVSAMDASASRASSLTCNWCHTPTARRYPLPRLPHVSVCRDCYVRMAGVDPETGDDA
jgi:hypothetical protein